MRSLRIHLVITACTLVATCIAATDALAIDYFVRKTGNDANAGISPASAWLTVDHAADSVTAGDTIYIGAGTYTENIVPAASCTGTVANPIRFIADTDGTQTGDAGNVVLTGTTSYTIHLSTSGHDYLELNGFEFAGAARSGIYSTGASTGLVVENCEIHGSGENGILFRNQEITIRNCSVHDNALRGIFLQSGAYGTIQDTSVYANGFSGILIAATTTLPPTPVVVNRCHSYGNARLGIFVISSNVTLTNCLLTDNLNSGIYVTASGSQAVTLQNCTVASNLQHGISFASGTNTITNCIVANNTNAGINDSSGSTRANNLIFGNDSGDTTANSTEIVADPQFVSSSDYHISSLSPAVNAGTDMTGTVDDDLDGKARPYNGAWDMGCYEEGPAGHYKLDETTGTIAADSSGNSYDGTYVNGPILGVTGIRGNAAELNIADTDDRIDLPHTVLDGAMDASVAFWIKTTNTGNAGVLSGAKASQDNAFTVFFSDSTTLRLYKGSYVGVTIPSVADNQWHHFVWTWDGNTNTATLYRNGLLVSSQVVTGTIGVPIDIDPGGLLLGQEQDSVGGGFNPSQAVKGSLDDVRIYRRAINAAEVALLYDGLVGHWKLDETTGTTAADSSGLGNDGTYLNGVTLNRPGPYPGVGAIAAEFDGVDDQVWIPSHSAYDITEAVTAATWVKFDTAVSLQTGGINFIDRSDWSSKAGYILLANQPYTNEVLFRVYRGGSYADAAWSGDNFAANTWYHLTGTFDGTTVRLYVNGSLVASTPFAGNIDVVTGAGVGVGYKQDGELHDARVYNRALSATEIAELYGLMGHWNMDEGTGATAADNTAFGNDATLYGATWTTDCAGNNGLEFDGLGDTAATNSVFDPPERGTVALWIRSDGPPAIRQRPWGIGSDYEMWQDPDGFISYDVSTDGFQGGFITNEPLHMDGRWYHLIAEYDSDDDSYSIYINGELHKSGISTWAMVKQAANTLTFGTRTGNTEYFEGALRDFRIYNRPLSGSEISELSGLVGYWKLDESSGTVAVDSSANSNDGTYTGGVLLNQSGQVDQAADFDGLDDYVAVPDDPSLQMDDTFSFSMWIRSNVNSSNVEGMILNKEGEYEIAITPSGELKWGITNTDPGWSWHATGHIVAFGKWTHVALTYNNGTVNTYANGVIVDTYNGSGVVGDQYPLLNELWIGGRMNNPPGKFFDGRIDDVRVFSRVLCPEEVFGQYRGGRPAGVRILQWVEVR